MESAKKLLRNNFKFVDFKSQDQAYATKKLLKSVQTNNNIILSMATQAGKSLAYQLLGAICEDGVTIVFSPSIALINDQLASLRAHNITAATINSSTPYSKRECIMSELESNTGLIKFLFITPEMADYNFALRNFFECGNINYFIVDEAHKIADSADFRTSFHKLYEYRDIDLKIRWIALTTADYGDCMEIGESLGMEDCHIIKTSSVRDNIFYDIKPIYELVDIGKFIRGLSSDSQISSGIIYCTKIDTVHQIVDLLKKFKISVDFYHSESMNKKYVLKAWKKRQFAVLVATDESFGFGINFNVPTVRFVIHIDAPKTLRSFYQESGRAGNDNNLGYSRIYLSSNERVSNSMKSYINSKCRRKAIARYFGDKTKACQKFCDKCVENFYQ